MSAVARIARLEKWAELQELRADNNAAVFASCLEQLEANDVLLQRAVSSAGNPEQERKTPSGDTDWHMYRQEYLVAAFLAWLVQLVPPPSAPPAVQLVAADEGVDDVVIFGGGQK